jgi:hypothetical protein
LYVCVCYFCGSGFSVFLLLLAVVVCWMARLHGITLVGCPFYAGQRGLELAGLLHLCIICFHPIGMIASKKLRHPYLFAAQIAPEPWYLNVFVLFLK